MNKGGLRLIDGENREALSAYRLLLTGEKAHDDEFKERFLDLVSDFLKQSEFRDFAGQVYIPFDQLTALVWKIKEREGNELDGGVELARQSVEKVKIKPAEQQALTESLFQKYAVNIDEASMKDLLSLSTMLLTELQLRLKHLSESYSQGLFEEELAAKLLAPEGSLMLLAAFNLWQQIGGRLEGLQSRLNSLRFSLQVYSAPVKVNHSIIERENIFLFNACRSLSEIVYVLQKSDNTDPQEDFRKVLDDLKVYPFYHKQYSHGAKIIVGAQLDFNHQPVSSVEKFLVSLKKKAIQHYCRSASAEMPGAPEHFETEQSEIVTEEIDRGKFLRGKIFGVIESLLDYRLVEEAEDLVRIDQLVNNRIDFSEYNSREEHFESWFNQRQTLKNVLQAMRKQKFTGP